jgi:hypothetical protein
MQRPYSCAHFSEVPRARNVRVTSMTCSISWYIPEGFDYAKRLQDGNTPTAARPSSPSQLLFRSLVKRTSSTDLINRPHQPTSSTDHLINRPPQPWIPCICEKCTTNCFSHFICSLISVLKASPYQNYRRSECLQLNQEHHCLNNLIPLFYIHPRQNNLPFLYQNYRIFNYFLKILLRYFT